MCIPLFAMRRAISPFRLMKSALLRQELEPCLSSLLFTPCAMAANRLARGNGAGYHYVVPPYGLSHWRA